MSAHDTHVPAGEGPHAASAPPDGHAHAHAHAHPPGYDVADSTEAVLRRLRRIEGQVRGIQGMVADRRYCLDVLQQVSAVQAALDKVALALVDDHTRHCVLDADPGTREERHAELMTALARMVGRR